MLPVPQTQETLSGLYGAWRLFRRDPKQAEACFRVDATGFWNSFFAAALVAPGYAILVGLHLAGGGVSADWASTFLIHTEAYVLTWIAFPLAMFYLSAGLQRPERWVPFIVAFNWSKVIQLAIYLPLSVLASIGFGGWKLLVSESVFSLQATEGPPRAAVSTSRSPSLPSESVCTTCGWSIACVTTCRRPLKGTPTVTVLVAVRSVPSVIVYSTVVVPTNASAR